MTSYVHQLLTHRLNLLVRHVGHVRENCLQLSQHFLDNDEPELAIEITARGLRHDQSKFDGIEWAYMHADVKESHPHLFQEAITHHWSKNDHHPEHWAGGVKNMTRAAIAEMVADWVARGQEFGSDVMEFIVEVACPRYGITQDGPVYGQITEFLGVLLERRFR